MKRTQFFHTINGDLEKATNILFKILREYYVDKNDILIEEDYYWYISKELVYNSYAEPTEFTLGQLSDDCNEINKIITGVNIATPYHLTLIANILRNIGETTVHR